MSNYKIIDKELINLSKDFDKDDYLSVAKQNFIKNLDVAKAKQLIDELSNEDDGDMSHEGSSSGQVKGDRLYEDSEVLKTLFEITRDDSFKSKNLVRTKINHARQMMSKYRILTE